MSNESTVQNRVSLAGKNGLKKFCQYLNQTHLNDEKNHKHFY